MSERMTSIRLPGQERGEGYADYGRKTPAEMIKLIREDAGRKLKVAQAILMAKDEDFYIDTYLGTHAQRKREVLQKGRKL